VYPTSNGPHGPGLRTWWATAATGILVVALASSVAAHAGEVASEPGEFPPGWIGVHVGMAMAVTEGSGVHLGSGWIVTTAHLVSGYAVGWNVEVFDPAVRGRPVVFRRARLMRMDEREDVALLRVDKPQGLSSVSACDKAPGPDEPVDFHAMTREGRIVSGIPRSRVRFVGRRNIPPYPAGLPAARLSGLERDAYRGVAEPGMSGGGAYAAGGACIHGILSLVDPAGDGEGPLTYVVQPSTFADWLPRAMDNPQVR
jgi:Trypsin-like peptidase domain